ncbi:MAG: hypothetical protein KKC46_06935 [Proteobacteria bacterium]|nr:hypothetical protein [Pseudomonadota bacterium]
MFSKENYINYFKQILALEQEMEGAFRFIQDNVSNHEYRKIFNRLADEERFHQKKVEEIINLFTK